MGERKGHLMVVVIFGWGSLRLPIDIECFFAHVTREYKVRWFAEVQDDD